MKHWWCMECQAKVGLGRHGRGEVCESEAVDLLPTDDKLNGPVSETSMDSDKTPACA